MTNCPFALTITRTAIRWQVEVYDPTYNYGAFAHSTALPHSKLKRFFAASNGNLFDVIWNIKNLIRNDINAYIITLARQRDRLPHDVRQPEFEDILAKVTPVCLVAANGLQYTAFYAAIPSTGSCTKAPPQY